MYACVHARINGVLACIVVCGLEGKSQQNRWKLVDMCMSLLFLQSLQSSSDEEDNSTLICADANNGPEPQTSMDRQLRHWQCGTLTGTDILQFATLQEIHRTPTLVWSKDSFTGPAAMEVKLENSLLSGGPSKESSPRGQRNNAWHDVLEICKKGFANKMSTWIS